MKKTILFLALLISGICLQAQVTVFEQNSKFGLKDASGDILVHAEYDHMLTYTEYSYTEPVNVLFVGSKGGKLTTTEYADTIYGYSPEDYTYGITGIQGRKHHVIGGGKYYLFNGSGQQINADAFDNIALNFAAPTTYDYGEPYIYRFLTLDDQSSPGIANRNMIRTYNGIMVNKNGKWGLMNMEPKYIIPCISDGLIQEMTDSEYEMQFYIIRKGNSKILFSKEGKQISGEYDDIGFFNTWENYSDLTKSVARVSKAGKYGYINTQGKEVIPVKYEYLVKVNADVFIFNKGGKFKYYEWNDSSAFTYRYDYYEVGYENYQPKVYVVKDSLIIGGKFGVIKDGKELIPASYSFIEVDLSTGYYFGHTGGKEPVDPKSYNNEMSYGYGEYDGFYGGSGEYNHYFNVEYPVGSKRCLIDKDGKVRIKNVESILLNYLSINTRQVDENGLYVDKATPYHLITSNGKNGLIDDNFKEVLPPKFVSFTYNYNLDNGTVIVNDDKNKFYLYSITTGKQATNGEYANLTAGDKFYIYNKGGKWTETENSYYDYYTDSTYSYKVTNLTGGRYGVIRSNLEDGGAIYDTIYIIGYKNDNYDYGYYDDWGYETNYNRQNHPIVAFKKNNMMGIFSSSGFEAIPAQFNSVTYDYSTKKLNIIVNNLHGLASLAGKVLIDPQYTALAPVGYSYYGGTSDKYLATNTNNLQGIIDTTGKIIFDFKYNWIDAYGFNQKKELIKVSIDGKFGYADLDGNQVLNCEYDDINEYFNYTSKITIVTKDGKKGFYDRETQKMITEPKYSDILIYDEKINGLTKVLSGGEVYWDSSYYANRIRGGKIGYVDSLGREIIPPNYKNVSYNNEIGIYLCTRGTSREYFDQKGNRVSDGETKWRNTYLGKKMMENQRIVELSWRSAGGPAGADATSFYYDEDGTYWLGTGSSGGVYRSADKGKTWKETNKGIGPRHIIFIDKLNDTLFIVDQGAGAYSNYELYSGEFGYFEAVHYWDSKTQSWIQVSEERKFAIADEINTKANSKKYENGAITPVTGYGLDINYFPSNLNSVYYYNSPFTFIGKYNSNTYGYDTVASKGIPKDCYPNAAGNVFKVEGDNYVLLSKSGIYKFSEGSSIGRLSEKGLLASDITQIEPLPNGGVVVREGTSDIWKYENNTWTILLDAYNLNEKLGHSDHGYYTGYFTIDQNGNILVPFRGNIYEFSTDGNMSVVVSAGNISAYTDYSDGGYSSIEFIQAVRDKNNKTWVLANAKGYYANNYGILQAGKNGALYYSDTVFHNSYGISFIFTDKKGNVWKYFNNSVSMLGNESKTSIKTNLYDMDLNKIATGPNGEVALIKSWTTLSVFVPDKMKWVDISLEGASSITSMEYDNKGNLMIATNYDFEYFCGEESKKKKADPFIGYIEFSMDGIKLKSLNNPVNPRVLSFCQHPSLGLLVGTSGTGLQMVTKR